MGDTDKKTTAAADSTTTDTTAAAEPEKHIGMMERVHQLEEHLKRSVADFENFRKRTTDEKHKITLMASKNLITELLPTIDNFDRAFAHEPSVAHFKEWVEGIKSVHDGLNKVLVAAGLEKVPTEKFDAHLHETVTTGRGKKDEILEVFEGGYMIGKDVIRHAKVKVGDGSIPSPEESKKEEKTEETKK